MATNRDPDRSVRPPRPTPRRYLGGVRGTRLRHAALAVLIRARGVPLSVNDIWVQVQRRHMIGAGVTRKSLADGLRHECRRGRATRVEHGYYVVGKIASRTRYRILAHERELRTDDTKAYAERYFNSLSQQ